MEFCNRNKFIVKDKILVEFDINNYEVLISKYLY